MKYKDEISQKTRINFFMFFFFFVFVAIGFRLFEIQVIKHGYYNSLAEGQHWVTRKIPATRGRIYTQDIRTGEKYVLATNKRLNMVYAIPAQIKDKKDSAKKLSEILSMEYSEIYERIDNEKLYAPIKRKLTEEETKKIEESKILGVLLSSENWREYPEGELASHILGFVNNDGHGQYGIEGYYDNELRGREGTLSMERDTSGRPIAVGDRIESPAQNGQDIVLTIDRVIQSYAEKELESTVEKFGASGGNVIVMDANNGDIWAMANYPYFDPNKYNEEKNIDIFKNTSISHVYEPGSIFKVLTMLAGIDSGAVSPLTTYTDTGSVKIGSHTIKNSDGKSNGVQTMAQVLEKSLNTGSYFVMEETGRENFYKYIEKFGFGKKTGIDLMGEVDSPLRSYNSLRDINFATMSFGQGIAVTPIQFICAASVIANGGNLVQPSLASEFVMPDGSKVKPQKNESVRVAKNDSASKIGAMMVSVVEYGHGKAAQIDGYKVAGKTGTAQVPAKDGSGYERGKNIGSFILFAPAQNARFVILAKIDEPKGVAWAESTAAPVAGNLSEKIVKYLEIPPTK